MSGHAVVEPRVYRAGLVFSAGGAVAMVFDVPGCRCSGRDEAEAVALLPVVVAEHLSWLDSHGDVTRDAFPFSIEIVERLNLDEMTDISDGEFCFQDDLRPSSADEVEDGIRQMGYARQDLLDVVRRLPDQVLDWQPPESAVVLDEWAPEVRSIRRILHHIAGSDGYYAGNVGDAPWRSAQPGDLEDLFAERHRAIERLRSLTDTERSAEFTRRQPWQERGTSPGRLVDLGIGALEGMGSLTDT
jgi:hypothetical protein